jgi:hypothetical protein
MTVQEENDILKQAIKELLKGMDMMPWREQNHDVHGDCVAFPADGYYCNRSYVVCPALMQLDDAGVIRLERVS